MDCKITFSDWDLAFEVCFKDEFRTGVIIEIMKVFESYEPWREEEKTEAINAIVKKITQDLSDANYKEKAIRFLRSLLAELEREKNSNILNGNLNKRMEETIRQIVKNSFGEMG